MSYQLGIDLGTTYTAAAISRATERAPAGVDVVTLGARSATVASVMYLADDGSVLVGEAAERRSLTDPDRVVREFKRRIGDDVPLMIGGRQYQAHELGARLVRWVVDLVSEREGGPPRRIAVTHPASWGQYKKDLLNNALRTVGLSVTFLAEPQAAAVSYASAERIDQGAAVAVYDLGGGTFDAAVVRNTGRGSFELLGQPEGLEHLGGIDFDEVVFAHVREAIGDKLDSLDPEDPDVLSAVARLRRECVDAKEALSSDTEATIPVLLPDLRTQTRIVRGEFEAMIRPALEETITALRRAVGSAGLTPDDLSAVLLVGGSSRIPLVSQLVSDELGRPVAVDADPKTAIAMGAALAISPQPQQQAPQQAPPAPSGPPPAHRTGGMPPVRPGAAAAGAGAAGVAAYAAGPGRPGGPGGPGGGMGGPPRPAMQRAEPPPRPDAGPQAASYGGDAYYAEPEKRKQTGMFIGIGGVIAIAVILALVFKPWDSSSTGSTGSSTDLTPSAPTTSSAPAETEKSTAPTHHTTPKATKAVPPPVTKNNPPTTSTRESKPTTSHETTPKKPSDSPKPSTGEDDDSSPSDANRPNSGAGDTNGASTDTPSNSRNSTLNQEQTTPTADVQQQPAAGGADGPGWSQPGQQQSGGGWVQPNSYTQSGSQSNAMWRNSQVAVTTPAS
ncbi:Hsp70 family protein [Pseudonocardia spinosispora]|uniref:Hsp70 family protein n=1 Tax=Pseudonocardia spinosispora TaxID=103441 RepID=UPI000688A099|nr:Hsp70 family protein [Pseudonocardia spinosispora]